MIHNVFILSKISALDCADHNTFCEIALQEGIHNQDRYECPLELQDSIIPNFVLQPLAENAIIHGIDGAVNDNVRQKLMINIYVDGEYLYCCVQNSGIAFSASGLNDVLTEKTKGYRLRNVQQRIQYLYGSDCGITLGVPYDGYVTNMVMRLKHISDKQ